jgi:hypothetical protein
MAKKKRNTGSVWPRPRKARHPSKQRAQQRATSDRFFCVASLTEEKRKILRRRSSRDKF